tara:strand:- start:2280 stop:2648 length:369 start_codon:yes stop_codon:yes gene_type:complete
MNDEDAIKYMVHDMNAEAHGLNKQLIQKTNTMQDIPLQKAIYAKPPPSRPAPPPQPGSPMGRPVPQQVRNTDPALLNSLIERVSNVEKQITKFVSLIERHVAKNAKEINIRIKLDNDSTNKE